MPPKIPSPLRLRRVLGVVTVEGPFMGRRFVFLQEIGAFENGAFDPSLRWVTEGLVDGEYLHGGEKDVRIEQELDPVAVDPRRLQVFRVGA